MIEAIVIQYLMDALQTDHVYAERPMDPPDEYYIVELTSSSERNHIMDAMIVVQSISGTALLRAAEMNQDVRRAMRNLISMTDVSRCELNSAYNFTDTSTKQYRYQAVFDIVYMEEE